MPNPETHSSEAFASLADYEAMYGAVPAADRQTITAQLQRASRIVRDELAYAGIDVYAERAAGKIRADTLTDVVCDMVNYSARQQAGGVLPGVTQATMTGGPYSQSYTLSSPAGSLSFTRLHRKRLGIHTSRFVSVHTIGGKR